MNTDEDGLREALTLKVNRDNAEDPVGKRKGRFCDQLFAENSNPGSSADGEALQLSLILRGVLSTAILIALISIGFGVYGIGQSTAMSARITPVDQQKCTCDCFDGVMKGIYFRRARDEPGKVEYKSWYINHDFNSWLMISWTTLCAAALAKLANKLSQLAWAGRLDYGWTLAVLVPLIYLFQYNFSSIMHYLNDRFYGILFNVQTFFNITSFVYAVTIYHTLDRQVRVPENLLLVASGIVCSHVFIALYEQGLDHLLKWNTHISLIARDGMFLICDLILLVYLMRQLSFKLTQRRMTVLTTSFFVCLMMFYFAVFLA